jgi:hypothetical protein
VWTDDGSAKRIAFNDSGMNLPRFTTVGGAYQYMMVLLLVLALAFTVLFGAMYYGVLSF